MPRVKTTIRAIGNEGFEIVIGAVRILVDAFYHTAPWVGSAPIRDVHGTTRVDLILVTHSHHDHFNAEETAASAARTGATVVGPESVTSRLRALKPSSLLTMEPPKSRSVSISSSMTVQTPAARITAFRTRHSPDHNSYLVETADVFRFFHDGDNEVTRTLDAKALKGIDALFIAPWQGSGWVEFIEAVAPRRWFLMHLTDEELEQQRKGEFLPDLCDHIPLPDALVTLGPGEEYTY